MRGRGGGGSERPAEQRWNRPWQTARLCSPPSDSVISCFLLYPFHYVLSFSLPPLTPLSFPPKLCDRGQWCIRNSGPPASPDPHYIWKAAVFFSFWASPFIPVKHLWTPFCFLYTYKHRNMCLHTHADTLFFPLRETPPWVLDPNVAEKQGQGSGSFAQTDQQSGLSPQQEEAARSPSGEHQGWQSSTTQDIWEGFCRSAVKKLLLSFLMVLKRTYHDVSHFS